MAETRRWDGDEAGHGVASAATYTGAVEDLLAAMREPDWVAEDPRAHLLPHVESSMGGPMRLRSAEVDDSGELTVLIEAEIPKADRFRLGARFRQLAFVVMSGFAESSTFVEEIQRDGGAEFVVTTGLLSSQTAFAPHGHVVRIVIVPTEGG
jgi:hypothetical protein